MTHNPANPPLSRWLKELMPVLHSSSKMRKVSPKPPIVGERKCPNLRTLLMPSRLPEETQQDVPGGCKKCTNKCVICKEHLVETDSFASVNTGRTYYISQPCTCQSTNLVYLIDCSRCGSVQYVGETGRTLQARFYGHRTDIRNKKDTLVAKHFNSANHTLADLRCLVIELSHSERPEVRKEREKFWRHRLKTNFPDGLNVFD